MALELLNWKRFQNGALLGTRLGARSQPEYQRPVPWSCRGSSTRKRRAPLEEALVAIESLADWLPR